MRSALSFKKLPDLVVPACRQTGKLSDAERGGLTSRQFARTCVPRMGYCGGAGVRYGLLQLDLGHDLTHIVTGKATRRATAPPDEVLALRPELRQAA